MLGGGKKVAPWTWTKPSSLSEREEGFCPGVDKTSKTGFVRFCLFCISVCSGSKMIQAKPNWPRTKPIGQNPLKKRHFFTEVLPVINILVIIHL